MYLFGIIYIKLRTTLSKELFHLENITEQQYTEFETFVKNHPTGSFMQSINWGKVKNNWKQELIVHRNAIGNIDGAMMLLVMPMGPGAMLYAPRGPVCDFNDAVVLGALINSAKEIGKKYNAHILKMDPFVSDDEANYARKIQAFYSCGCTLDENAAFKDTIQPRYNYMLTYIKGMADDDLLMCFNSNTRYYIRFAIKNGIECKNMGFEGLDEFYKIYASTGERQEFLIRPKEYLERLLTSFGENARLYMCYYNGEPLCGGICVQYAGRTSHIYGCTKYNPEMRKLHPTYLLQWEMMRWALEGNCHTYDMQGIAINKDDSEALYNVYGFKKNFKGSIVTTAGEFEIILRPFYNKCMNLALKLRSALKKQ